MAGLTRLICPRGCQTNLLYPVTLTYIIIIMSNETPREPTASPSIKPRPGSTSRALPAADLDHRMMTFALLLSTLAAGVAYSVYYDTYYDTSNPLIAHLPHPSHGDSYFARKSNVFNQLFVKKAWGWTSLAFFLIYATSPLNKRSMARVGTWFATTWLWGAFTLWFFGPSLFERVLQYSGAECVVTVPPTLGNDAPYLLNVPLEYCHTRSTVGIDTHPALFTSMLMPPQGAWTGRPRLYRGHDVSGHIFLLTLCIFFLADQIAISLKPRPSIMNRGHAVALSAAIALLGIWWWMSLMTAVYFHTPMEKITGFGTLRPLHRCSNPSALQFHLIVLFLRSDGNHRLCNYSNPDFESFT